MDVPPPYPGPPSEKKEQQPCFNNMDLPPPPPYDGLEGQRIIITEAPVLNVGSIHGQRIIIPPLNQATERIESYMILSLFTLCCCCFPLGLIATVLSCQVGIYAQRGEVRKARYVSEKAKHVATIGILIGTLTVVYMFVQKVKFFQQVHFVNFNYDDDLFNLRDEIVPAVNATKEFKLA